jgi:hypothetical protein
MSKELDSQNKMDRLQVDQYHPLARDPDGHGFWGRIDRWTETVSGWLNPILIKEARQSLKSRQFLVTFFLLLLASCLWTILGVTSNSPSVYYLPTGSNLLAGYYLVLAIPLIGMVPLAAHRSLAAEIEDDTFEMLTITRLSAGRIVMGKLNSAMLQMGVYFAAIVPCIAFSYLLRGITLPMIGTLVTIVFMTALLVTSLALLMATVSRNRAGQTLATLLVVGVIVFAEITCGVVCMGPVLYSGFQDFREMMIGTGVYVVIGMSCVILFIKAAAAQIAPLTENRSTGLRWCMFLQQLLWIAIIGFIADYAGEPEISSAGVIVIGIYWLLMGTLMLGESPKLSPRVQRGLPKTFAGRTLMTWFNPGPDTGYIFAIATGTIGAIALGCFGFIVQSQRGNNHNPILVVIVCIGYLLSYLGTTRLLLLPFARRFGPSFVASLTIGITLLVLGLIIPFVFTVTVAGNASLNYGLFHVSNWAWTLSETFRSGFDPAIAVFLLMVGLIITALNLLLTLRAFKYRRITVPDRVMQDQGKL